MSIFASQTQDTIPLPLDPGQTITIRKLTGREIEQAQVAHASGLAIGAAWSWAERFRRTLEHGADDARVQALLADPLNGFDRQTLIRCGLIAWSYPQSIKPVPAQPEVPAKDGKPAIAASPAQDAIGDLDDEAMDFIARSILKLTKPWLFETVAEQEHAQKNG